MKVGDTYRRGRHSRTVEEVTDLYVLYRDEGDAKLYRTFITPWRRWVKRAELVS